jgi:hypothetical protein
MKVLKFFSILFVVMIIAGHQCWAQEIKMNVEKLGPSCKRCEDGYIKITLTGLQQTKINIEFYLYKKAPWEGGKPIQKIVSENNEIIFSNLRKGSYLVGYNINEDAKLKKVNIEVENKK